MMQPEHNDERVVNQGAPLSEINDIHLLQKMVEALWQLLDDIDTASDMIKPNTEEGYKVFYQYVMRKVAKRHAVLSSDGYELFLPK